MTFCGSKKIFVIIIGALTAESDSTVYAAIMSDIQTEQKMPIYRSRVVNYNNFGYSYFYNKFSVYCVLSVLCTTLLHTTTLQLFTTSTRAHKKLCMRK